MKTLPRFIVRMEHLPDHPWIDAASMSVEEVIREELGRPVVTRRTPYGGVVIRLWRDRYVGIFHREAQPGGVPWAVAHPWLALRIWRHRRRWDNDPAYRAAAEVWDDDGITQERCYVCDGTGDELDLDCPECNGTGMLA